MCGAPMHDTFEHPSKRLEELSPIAVDGSTFAVWLIDIREKLGSSGVRVAVGAKGQGRHNIGDYKCTATG